MAVAILCLQVANEFLHIVDIVVKMKFSVGQRHVACVFPVGDIDLMVFQHGFDRVTQQGGVVTRQGRYDQHGGLAFELVKRGRVVGEALETAQFAKRLVNFDALINDQVNTVGIDPVNVKSRLFVILTQTVHQAVTGRKALTEGRFTHWR